MDNYKAKFGEQLKEEENLNTLIAENLGDIRLCCHGRTKLFNLIHDVQYVIRVTCLKNHEWMLRELCTMRPLQNASIVIASEAKQSHNTLIGHEIAASLCSSQ